MNVMQKPKHKIYLRNIKLMSTCNILVAYIMRSYSVYNYKNRIFLKVKRATSTFPKFHMMFYTPGNSGDDTGGPYLQKPHVNFLNALSTVFWVKPQTN